MSIKKSFIIYYISLSLLYSFVESLYEDQVGSFDWHSKFVGHVTWSSLEQSGGGRRKVLLGNEHQGVIAAVNAGPGTIAWRQELGERLTNILHHQAILFTTSGDSHVTLRAWYTDTGLLKWEVPTSVVPPTEDWPLTSQWRPGSVVLTIAGTKKDQLVIASGSSLSVHSLRSGKELWSLSLNGFVSFIKSVDNQVWVWLTEEEGLRMETINLSDRQVFIDKNVHDSWLTNKTDCVLSGTSVTCYNPVEMKFYYLQDEVFEPLEIETISFPSLSSHSSIQSISNSLFLLDNKHLMSIDPTSLSLHYLCSSCGISKGVTIEGEEITLRVEEMGGKGDSILVVSSTNEEIKNSFSINSDALKGGVVKVNLFVLNRPGEVVWRALVTRQDSSISFISSNGELIWTREEALAAIVAVETVDLPSSQSSTEGFLSLLDDDLNPLLLGFKRLSFQLNLAQEFFSDLLQKGVSSLVKPTRTEELLRDEFNTHKVIVALTSFSKVYGIDSINGHVIWQLHLPSFHPFINQLYVIRSSLHPPHPPLVAVLGIASHCNSGSVLYEFNPISGKLTNQICLPYAVIQVVLLTQNDHIHQRKLLLIDESRRSHCYPSGCNFDKTPPIFVYNIDLATNLMMGVSIDGVEQETRLAWQSIIPENENILTVVNNRHGHTHSMGRVRSDRSVQYKYMNPNLVAIATEATDQGKSNIHIYLMDGVNGGVVYHVTHKLANGPVNLVLCENWMIYTLYNVKSYRYEIVVTELYDSRNETESMWSSLAPPVLPIVTSQSYAFQSAIHTLSYTVTQKGITNKNLLLGLSSGHILSLDKNLLDPRRNITPTQEAMDDGLPLYMPTIPMESKLLLNYNQTVTNIKGVHTTCTGLESTSLVFAYGLDLYLTRVTPSKQFDVLAEDFDYKLIALVVGGLALATVITSKLSGRKALNLVWQ